MIRKKLVRIILHPLVLCIVTGILIILCLPMSVNTV